MAAIETGKYYLCMVNDDDNDLQEVVVICYNGPPTYDLNGFGENIAYVYCWLKDPDAEGNTWDHSRVKIYNVSDSEAKKLNGCGYLIALLYEYDDEEEGHVYTRTTHAEATAFLDGVHEFNNDYITGWMAGPGIFCNNPSLRVKRKSRFDLLKQGNEIVTPPSV